MSEADLDERFELSAEWQDWVTDNALSGASATELIEAIVEEGVERDLVEREVLRLLSSGPFRAAQRWRRQALRYKKVHSLKVALHRGHGPQELERLSGVSPEVLRAHYLRACQPVILTDVVSEWPALTRWTDEYLKGKIGHIEVTCCKGRDQHSDYNLNISRFYTNMSFAAFLDEVSQAGESNDLYLVGNNKFLQREGVDVLLKDLDERVEAYLTGPVSPARASLWIGPAGTLTSLHYDPTSVLYAQIRGQKRFRLLSPHNLAALLSSDGTYSGLSCEEAAEQMDDRVYEVTLSPGELLLIPAGWWHEVLALTPSVSLGMTNLQGPTSFEWYYPGKVY